ncbi:hypothetical protein ACFPYI_13685 [Halomarina salina]|uniref:HAD family hydrolase n=1 Tax=Halomarina salina TaxID=1872699 RepID=A0ABD5RP46_9EURY|nr:hypothetical protein [Halomarina salina]
MNLPDGARILVDVDGTLCDNLPRLVEYVDREHGAALDPAAVTEWQYHVPEVGMHVGELIDDAMADHPEWFLLGMDPLPGAADGLARLREAGYEVHIATHRPATTHDVTREWLEAHGIPFDGYEEAVPRNKAELEGHALVDDYHRNVGDALAAGKAGALFRQPYSDPTACDGALVVESWDGFVDSVV